MFLEIEELEKKQRRRRKTSSPYCFIPEEVGNKTTDTQMNFVKITKLRLPRINFGPHLNGFQPERSLKGGWYVG